MKNTKYRRENLCIYDYRGVEEHLSAMAAGGWQLESIGVWLWKYRRAEPAKVRYAVTYSDDASQFNPGPTEGQQSLAELCEAAGWEKVCDWFQMQIFRTEDPGAVPLETDESIRLEGIHRSMRKNFLPSNIVLLIVGLLFSYSFLGTLFVKPLRIFERNGKFLTGPLFVLVVILEIYTLFHYYRWRRKSLRSVAEGGPCAPINTKAYQLLNRAGLVLVGVIVAAYLLMEFFSGNRNIVLFYVVYVSTFVLLVFLLRRTTALLRKLNVSKWTNILGTLLADVVLVAIMIGGLTYGVIHFGWFTGSGGRETYVYQNFTWDVNPVEDVPLTLSDLTGVQYEHIYRRRTAEGSFFLPGLSVWEVVLSEDGKRLYLSYDFCTPKFSWLQEALLEDWLADAEMTAFPSTRRYEAEDPAPWGAEAAYRRYWDNTPSDTWLLVWPDRVAVVELDSPTPEQRAVIGARLGPQR